MAAGCRRHLPPEHSRPDLVGPDSLTLYDANWTRLAAYSQTQ
jgi:hypothetical protein